MIQLIKILNIEQLLGWDDITPEELTEIENELVINAINISIVRLGENPLASEEEKQRAKNFIEMNTNTPDFNGENFKQKILAEYPEFQTYLEDAIYLQKRDVLLSELESDLSVIVSDDQAEQTEWIEGINYLKEIINEDRDSEFDSAWALYIDFKRKKNGTT